MRLKQMLAAEADGSDCDSGSDSGTVDSSGSGSGSPSDGGSDQEWSQEGEDDDDDEESVEDDSDASVSVIDEDESDDESEELAWSDNSDDGGDWSGDEVEDAKQDRIAMFKFNEFRGQLELLLRQPLPEALHEALLELLSAFARPNEEVRGHGWIWGLLSELQPVDDEADESILARTYEGRVRSGMRAVLQQVKARGGSVPRWLQFCWQSSEVLVRLGANVLLARAEADKPTVLPSGVPVDAPQLRRVAMEMIKATYAKLDDTKVFAQFYILSGFALADVEVAGRFASLEAAGRFKRQQAIPGAVVRPKATVLGSRRDVEVAGHFKVRILLFQPGQEDASVVVYAHLPKETQCMRLHAALLAHAEAMIPPQPAYVAFLQNTFASHAICNSPGGRSRAPPDGRMIELACMDSLRLPADKKGGVYLVAVERGAAVEEKLVVNLKAVCLVIKRRNPNKKRKKTAELREAAIYRVLLEKVRRPDNGIRFLDAAVYTSMEPLHRGLQKRVQKEVDANKLPPGTTLKPFADKAWKFGLLSTSGLSDGYHCHVKRASLAACVEKLRGMRFCALEKLLLGCIGEGKPPLIVARYCDGDRLVQPPSATDQRSIRESLWEDGTVRMTVVERPVPAE